MLQGFSSKERSFDENPARGFSGLWFYQLDVGCQIGNQD
jgi:hypothetical protein